MLLGEYLAGWLTAYIEPCRAKSTVQGYRAALRHLSEGARAADLGDPGLAMILQADIYTLARNYSRQAQILYAVLHCAMRRAVRMGYIMVSPMVRVDKPRHRGRAMRWLTVPQLARYLDAAADSDLYVRLALMAVCGLRRGEALAVEPGDVDAARELLMVRRQRQGAEVVPLKTECSRRDIPLRGGMLMLLLNRDDYGECSEATLAREHKRVLDAAGLPRVTMHELRHTCATTMIGAGVPMMVVQNYLGHSGYQVTADIYGHVAGDDLRAAAGVFDGIVGNYQQMMAL